MICGPKFFKMISSLTSLSAGPVLSDEAPNLSRMVREGALSRSTNVGLRDSSSLDALVRGSCFSAKTLTDAALVAPESHWFKTPPADGSLATPRVLDYKFKNGIEQSTKRINRVPSAPGFSGTRPPFAQGSIQRLTAPSSSEDVRLRFDSDFRRESVSFEFRL